MSVYECLLETWQKRFMQRHYSYRDSHDAATVLFPTLPAPLPSPEAQSLAAFAVEFAAGVPGTVYYPFGYNARNWTTGIAALTNAGVVGSKFSWPHLGDYASGVVGPRGQCYARDVMVYVTEDTWIRFVSVNPIYGTLIAQVYSVAKIAALGVSPVITEVEHFVAAGDKDTFSPTFGAAIVFRADTVAGMIYISAEGNVEGGE